MPFIYVTYSLYLLENVIRPEEASLPRFVLIITDYANEFGVDKMREGRRVFQELKIQYNGISPFLK